jgi:hypothetical protein
MKLLAGLDVTAKAVERIAESIGVDIALRQQKDIQSAKQLCLPTVTGSLIPHLYIEMDGTQVFVVKSETEGRVGRTPGEPGRTRECKLGAVFAQATVDDEGRPVRDENSTTYVGAIETAEEFGLRIYTEAWNRGCDRAAVRIVILVTARTESGTTPISIFPAQFKSSISTMPASISGFGPQTPSRR